MEKELYICATPYQVMGASLLNLDRNKQAVIVIVNKFAGSEELSEKIRREKLFARVVFLDETTIWKSKSKHTAVRRLSTIKTYVQYRQIVERVVPDIQEVKHLFVSSRGAIARLFCMYIAELMPDAEIHYYDDGMGSYTNKEVRIRKSDELLRRILVGKASVQYRFDRYLYSPAFYFAINGRRDAVSPMPSFSRNAGLMNRIFEYDDSMRMKAGVIVFEGLIEDDFTERGREIYISAIKGVLSSFDDVMIKSHPRAAKEYFDAPYYRQSNIPFEIICANDNYQDKILITSMSTAVFTPKLLLNQEPVIVLLYKLFGGEWKRGSEYDDLLCDSIRGIYTQPDRVFVPESLREFEDFLSGKQKHGV